MASNKAATSMFWAIGERFATQGTLFVISLILARLLSPSDYGTLSLLLVFTNLADVLVTNGLGEALIQKSDINQIDYSTMLSCSIALSSILYVLIFFSAPSIADFYGNANMCLYLRVLALRLPLSALNAIQKAYIAKNFLFRLQFSASFLSSLISGLAAIVAAMLGFGIYALIIQQILIVLMTTVLMAWLTKWTPRLKFVVGSARELLPLGIQFTSANLINSIYTEGRSLVIGKFYSSADLAFFNRGNQFPALIVGNLNTPISNVMLPLMAEKKDSQYALKSVLRKAMQLSAYLVFPMMGILAACAHPLVLVLLGQKWAECVPYLQVACLFYLFQPLQSMNWQALKAAGQGALCFKLEVIKKAISFIVLIMSIPFGVFAISLSSAFCGFVSMLINMTPNKKVLGYGIFEQLIDVLKPSIATLFSVVIALLLIHISNGNLISLIVAPLGSLGCYIVLSKLMNIEGFNLLMDKLSLRRN